LNVKEKGREKAVRKPRGALFIFLALGLELKDYTLNRFTSPFL
jgi:hypothetical protein